MTEAIIYATVIVTAATLAYWWPAIRRKWGWWRLNRQMSRARASVEQVGEAFGEAAEQTKSLVSTLHHRLANAALDQSFYPRTTRGTQREDGLYTAWVQHAPNAPLTMAHGETMQDAIGRAMGNALRMTDDH